MNDAEVGVKKIAGLSRGRYLTVEGVARLEFNLFPTSTFDRGRNPRMPAVVDFARLLRAAFGVAVF
jgi:hypothetical protein